MIDRRETLKLLILGAVASERLARVSSLVAQEAGFASRWDEWPDVRWAGPEYWSNRLQDWSIRDGAVECHVRAPNRTLHCLTHTAQQASYRTAVDITLGDSDANSGPALAGFRVGAKGRFDGVRSAAVHGVGVDVGIDERGSLVIGDQRSAPVVPSGSTVRLQAEVAPVRAATRVTLVARSTQDGRELGAVSRDDLPAEALIGNCALLSHLDEAGPGQGPQFRSWTLEGDGIAVDPDATFGPIMFAQYTLHRGILKLTAQLAPLDEIANLVCHLDIRGPAGGWTTIDSAEVDTLARTARFRADSWDGRRAVEYRVRVTLPLGSGPADFEYVGTIAAEPGVLDPVKAAVFSCNADHGFPDADVVQHVQAHRPDMALFLGDQFYESSGGFGIQTEPVDAAALDMLHKWYMFGWSYRELFRHIPSAFIPDDHDVYHGNVWGEAGKQAPTEEGWGAVAQDQGGYKMPPEWVNAVQLAQTSHLPDPYDPTPVNRGIGVYYTRWDYAGVSFAILEDRKFKSSPANVLPDEAQVLNGWIQNPEFDVREHPNPPGSELLGPRQMSFLEDWAEDWSGSAYMKVVLSQTNFAAVHTIPTEAMSGAVLPSLPMPQLGDYVAGDKVAVDMDSNGWPSAHRDDVLRILRRCSAFHVAGDQHLATVVRHGVDEFGDAGFSFTGPALNNIWPRRWWPPTQLRQAPLEAGGPDYTGDFFDGFGNRITVHASANPRATGLEPAIIHDRVTGYGIVTFDKATAEITVECWPRHVDPNRRGARQYEGWPITVKQESGDGRTPVGQLPVLRVTGLENPVVELRTMEGALIYARRIRGTEFTPPVFARQTHRVRVGEPDQDIWMERTVEPSDWGSGRLDFEFTQ